MKDRLSPLRPWLLFVGIVAALLGLSMLGKMVYVFKGKMALPLLAVAAVMLIMALLAPRKKK